MPFFEIGGMIYETTYRGQTKGLAALHGTRPMSTSSYSAATMKIVTTQPSPTPQVQEKSKSTFTEDFKEGLQDEADYYKVRAGSTAIGTGVKIGRAAAVVAMADGPLPVGDVIAAGILIGGGIYLIGSGLDWW